MPAYERDRASHQRNAVQRSSRSAAAPLPPILALQRAAGNAAVTHMVEVQRERDEELHEHGAGCGHDQSVQRSSVLDVLRTPGTPVDPAIRAKAEQGLGTYLGDVVVHAGAAARRSAAELGARAYTSGRHIVVGEGGNNEHTMLHELAHAWQQKQGPVPGTENGGGLSVSDEGDSKEQEAEAWAHRLKNISGQAQAAAGPADGEQEAAAAPVSAPAVQRMPRIIERVPRGEIDDDDRSRSPRRRERDYDHTDVSYVTRHSMAGVPRRRNPDQNTVMGGSARDAMRAAGRYPGGDVSWLHGSAAWVHGDPVHGTPQRRGNLFAGTQATNMEHLRLESAVSGRGVGMLGAPITQIGLNGRAGPNVYDDAEYVVRSPYDPNDRYSRRLDPYDTRSVGARERAGDLPRRERIHRDMESQFAHWTMNSLPDSEVPREYREWEEERRRGRRSASRMRGDVEVIERRPRP